MAVWDLREPASIHRAVMTENGPVRFPTFNTGNAVFTGHSSSNIRSINQKGVAHVAAAGFLSRYLNCPLPYV